jgi:hypothetical protein
MISNKLKKYMFYYIYFFLLILHWILSECSYEFINNQNKLYIKRERETILFDALAFKMMYTQKETGQDLVTNKLNKFKNASIERSWYVDRTKLIDEQLLTSYYSFLDNKINELFYKTNNTSYQVWAVDGTKANAYSSAEINHLNLQ